MWVDPAIWMPAYVRACTRVASCPLSVIVLSARGVWQLMEKGTRRQNPLIVRPFSQHCQSIISGTCPRATLVRARYQSAQYIRSRRALFIHFTSWSCDRHFLMRLWTSFSKHDGIGSIDHAAMAERENQNTMERKQSSLSFHEYGKR